MSLQKIVNVLAVASATVSVAVVGTVGYVYVNREAIIEDVKEKALGSIMCAGAGLGALGGAAGGLGGDLPVGAPDLATPTDTPQAAAPAAPTAPIQF